MDKHNNQVSSSTEKNHTQHYGAHSNFRKGLSDYNDGGKYWHYGGNDDQYSRGNKAEDDSDAYDGKVAYGNDSEESSEVEDEFGKYHSGL